MSRTAAPFSDRRMFTRILVGGQKTIFSHSRDVSRQLSDIPARPAKPVTAVGQARAPPGGPGPTRSAGRSHVAPTRQAGPSHPTRLAFLTIYASLPELLMQSQ
jgi:hypothetical protein